ncbi:hypothetical protein GCM10009127_09480 [Alteraurantiacibacter aestuarii]
MQEMALAYVARYATSSAKLERYLARKLRERGWAENLPPPDISALVDRYVELGYIDDEAFARAKSGSLMRRGYGNRRVDQELGQAGISSTIREDVRAGEAEQRHAALALARKRRFGPFARDPSDRDRREKHIAAMLRAGHSLDSAREMVDAASEQAALEWAHELDEELHDED